MRECHSIDTTFDNLEFSPLSLYLYEIINCWILHMKSTQAFWNEVFFQIVVLLITAQPVTCQRSWRRINQVTIVNNLKESSTKSKTDFPWISTVHGTVFWSFKNTGDLVDSPWLALDYWITTVGNKTIQLHSTAYLAYGAKHVI